jgi:hypothetical protein
VKVSYCVVNTNGRDHLIACLDAIERTHPAGVDREVLVLDNSSDDGSVAAVRASRHEPRLIELGQRAGKAENDSTLLKEASGDLCLLLNEDAELLEGATAALIAALESDPRAAVAGGRLLTPSGVQTASAWRLPGVATALAGALFLHRAFTVQSRGERTRRVGWVQSSSMLVRRSDAAEVGYLDPDFFVYSDETDFCKRLHDAGHRILYVPAAAAIHHDQLANDMHAARRRMVEFHRNRDRYMRKHHGPGARAVVRALGVWFYGIRALAAVVIPGQNARRYLFQARQELAGGRGDGIREAAEEYNRRARIAP